MEEKRAQREAQATAKQQQQQQMTEEASGSSSSNNKQLFAGKPGGASGTVTNATGQPVKPGRRNSSYV